MEADPREGEKSTDGGHKGREGVETAGVGLQMLD